MAVAVTRTMASRRSSIFGIVDGFDAHVAGLVEHEGFHCGPGIAAREWGWTCQSVFFRL